MSVNYDKVVKVANEKNVDTCKLFVALSQLARMEGTASTVAAILAGSWSMTNGVISLHDKTDPNRSEINYLYQKEI